MRALRFTLAFVLAIVAGVAGASAVIGSTGSTIDNGPALLQPDGSGAVIAATATDPDADAAPPAPNGARGSRPAAVAATADSDWAVRVYRSEAGYTCPEAGREVDGDFGRVDGDGSFHPLALAASGQCVDLSKDQYSLDVDHYPADDQRGARAVVYGAVGPDVTGVTLVADGTRTALDIADGAYVAAIDDDDAASTQVELALADGTTRTQDLPASMLTADGARP